MKRVVRTSGRDSGRSPHSKAGRAIAAKPVNRGVSPYLHPRTGRILVVSTDPYDRLQLEAMLLTHGYTVMSASSFEEASNLLQAIPVDLLITSLELAAFNGLHLAIRSRGYDPRRKVIITHDRYDPTLNEQAELLGVRFVADPMESPAFLECVDQALHNGRYTKLMA